jgi:2-phosphosulfolactate phosphatase
MLVDAVLTAREVHGPTVSGRVAVVMDVLRATSTITTALANGCTGVHPVLSPEEGHDLARSFSPGSYVLGGERGGLRIPGFDLGNSPREYTPDRISGKALIMTTTNGTLAIRNCQGAYRLYVASLLNAPSVAKAAATHGRDAILVCSGTHGAFSLEDAYCAGMVAHHLKAGGAHLKDLAEACRIIFAGYSASPLSLLELAEHGKELVNLGFPGDLEYCARSGSLDVTPVLKNGKLVAESQ